MNKKCFIAMLMLFLILTMQSPVLSATRHAEGFDAFKTRLTKAVNANDRAMITSLMSEQFQWSTSSKKVSPREGLRNMDEFKLWKDFKKALKAGKIEKFSDSSCKDNCYMIYNPKSPVMYIIQKIDNEWKWTELRGD